MGERETKGREEEKKGGREEGSRGGGGKGGREEKIGIGMEGDRENLFLIVIH